MKPACVVRIQTTTDGVTIDSHLVQCNQLHGIGSTKCAIGSGGYACFARSTNEPGGVTIDLRSLNSIEVNKGFSEISSGLELLAANPTAR